MAVDRISSQYSTSSLFSLRVGEGIRADVRMRGETREDDFIVHTRQAENEETVRDGLSSLLADCSDDDIVSAREVPLCTIKQIMYRINTRVPSLSLSRISYSTPLTVRSSSPRKLLVSPRTMCVIHLVTFACKCKYNVKTSFCDESKARTVCANSRYSRTTRDKLCPKCQIKEDESVEREKRTCGRHRHGKEGVRITPKK